METKPDMLRVGRRVSVLLARRTPDVPIITLDGLVEAYDGNVIGIRGRRVSHSSMTYSERESGREKPLDREPRLFVLPLTSVRLIEIVESSLKGSDVVAEEIPVRRGALRRNRSV